MKNIALICSKLAEGGAERILGYLSVLLSAKYRVYLFLSEPDRIIYDYKGTIVDIGKDGYIYCEYYIKYYKRFYNIDCAISFMEPFNFMNVRTKEHEKVILTVHSTCSQRIPYRYSEVLQMRELYPFADNIVCVSQGVVKDCIENILVESSDFSAIYNPVLVDEILSRSAQPLEDKVFWDFKGDAKIILAMGRLTEAKNYPRLLYAFHQLAEKMENVKLVILGEGKLTGKLEDIIAERHLNDLVHIFPFQSNPFNYLIQADVFVLPSRYEGSGNVIQEAMTLGIPVVSVDCFSGPRELLTGCADYENEIPSYHCYDRGILVSREYSYENDPLTDAMYEMLTNVEYRKNVQAFYKNIPKELRNKNTQITQQWLDMIERPYTSRQFNSFLVRYRENEHSVPVVIYGAGGYAEKIFKELENNDIKVQAFIVTEASGKQATKLGLPIYEKNCYFSQKREVDIIIGVSNIYQDEVVGDLLKLGVADSQIKFLPLMHLPA